MPDQRAAGKAHVGVWAHVDLVQRFDERAAAVGVKRTQLLLAAMTRLLADPQGGYELKQPRQPTLIEEGERRAG
jgi:hypothetical protein